MVRECECEVNWWDCSAYFLVPFPQQLLAHMLWHLFVVMVSVGKGSTSQCQASSPSEGFHGEIEDLTRGYWGCKRDKEEKKGGEIRSSNRRGLNSGGSCVDIKNTCHE